MVELSQNDRDQQKLLNIVGGIFYALAGTALTGRMAMKVKSRRKPESDDYFLILAFLCLTTAFAIPLDKYEMFVVASNLKNDPNLAASMTPQELDKLAKDQVNYSFAFSVVCWCCIFAVKFSYLMLFRTLVRNVNKVQKYFWVVFGFTVISWMYAMAEPIFEIACTKVLDVAYCFEGERANWYMPLAIPISVVDITTDAMIISIPIVVLRKARIKLRQKLAFGFILSLSAIMIVLSIVRALQTRRGGNLLMVGLWQYLEGAVAVVMGSVTAFRSVFMSYINHITKVRQQRKSRSLKYLLLRRTPTSEAASEPKDMEEGEALPAVPRATMTGMRTFIRRNNKPTNEWTVADPMRMETEEEFKPFTTQDELELMGLRKSKDANSLRPGQHGRVSPTSFHSDPNTVTAFDYTSNPNTSRGQWSAGSSTVVSHGSIPK